MSDPVRYLQEYSNWGRWGDDDQLGTLNLITPEARVRAAGLVREGFTVPCGRTIEFAPKPRAAEAPVPPLHFMQASGEEAPAEGQGVAYDWVGLPLHGLYLTHLDAHGHLFWDGKMYNGVPASTVRADRGAVRGGIDNAGEGIFTRGVLLDAASARGLDWLEQDVAVTAADLEAAETQAGVRAGRGDAVLVRTGYGARRLQTDPGRGLPGLGPDCLEWIHDRAPAVIGTDTGTDPTPAGEGAQHHHGLVASPIHVVALVAMGMWIIDGCELEALVAACRRLGRWEFLFVTAPLRLKNSTGSPINPLAVF
jgi:kynurenine formamidase